MIFMLVVGWVSAAYYIWFFLQETLLHASHQQLDDINVAVIKCDTVSRLKK